MSSSQKKKNRGIMTPAVAMLQYPDFLTYKSRPRYSTEELKGFIRALKGAQKAVHAFSPPDDDTHRVLEILGEIQGLIAGTIKQRRRGPKEQYNLDLVLYGVASDYLKKVGNPCYEEISKLLPTDNKFDRLREAGAEGIGQRVRRFVARHPELQKNGSEQGNL